MKSTFFAFALSAIVSISTFSAKAQSISISEENKNQQVLPKTELSSNDIDEIDPFDPNINEIMDQMDESYYQDSGELPWLEWSLIPFGPDCKRQSCSVWARVIKSQQKMELYLNGNLYTTWAVSTGAPGVDTPNFDRHPNGRIYDAYSSKKFPGGDYNGLGNMPYAVFIDGGFAIHGTPRGNWAKLGSRASHGCVRIHPENARVFNRLVRQYGIYQTWITIQD